MAASYPSSIPDLATLVLSNPQSFAQATRHVEEDQAILDTLGVNPQGSSGTVASRLAALDTALAIAANTAYRNLRSTNNATTPTTKLDVSADVIAIEGQLRDMVAVTIDLTVIGKNGMTATRAVSTWYYIWLGVHPGTGEVCGILDDSSVRASIDVSHASLAGFTAWRRVGARRTNATGSGELVRCMQHDQLLLYDAQQAEAAAHSPTANTWYTRAVDSGVPSTARAARIGCAQFFGTATQATTVSMMGVDAGRPLLYGAGLLVNDWVTLDASAQFRWKCNQTVTDGVFFWVSGYQDSI